MAVNTAPRVSSDRFDLHQYGFALKAYQNVVERYLPMTNLKARVRPNSGEWLCPDRGDISAISPTTAGKNETVPDQPFGLPGLLTAQLADLYSSWSSLRRGSARIPFSDDLAPSEVGKLVETIAFLRVFQKPQRFLFDFVGTQVATALGGELDDLFADELGQPAAPLNYFVAQCSATIEAGTPTYYSHSQNPEYQRLLLPLWGDGHVNAILAAFDLRRGIDAA